MKSSICYNLLVLEMFSLSMLIITDIGFSEEKITITRRIGFKDDEFTIPSDTCKNKKCGHYGASDAVHPPGCKCLCSAAVETPGFFYLNRKWQCTTQINIRKQQGCRFLMIPFEKSNLELYSLRSGDRLPLNLQYTSSRAGCKVDVSRSSFMSCQGNWIPLNQTEAERFEIMKPHDLSENKTFHIKVTGHVGGFNLDGRLIKLAFSKECSTSINQQNRCMLFKLQGTFTCPIEIPYKPTSQPVITRQLTEKRVVKEGGKVLSENKDINTEKHTTMKQSDNSTIGGTPNKVSKNNQDIVFIICGGVALVAVIFIVIIIINLRRTERRNQRRATAAMASTHAFPKSPMPQVVLAQKVDGEAATNGGFVDDVSYITEVTTHSGSSGYSSDGDGIRKVTATAKSSNYDELIEEDAEGTYDPIYENICDKCKDLNLVGPCEHVETYDSDDGPVYVNLEEEEGEEEKEGEQPDKDEGEKKLSSSNGEGDKTTTIAQENQKGTSEENQVKHKQNVEDLEKTEPSESLSSVVHKKNSSKRSKKRKRKHISAKRESKLKKQSSAEKPVKQDKQDLVGNIEQEHSDNEDIGGEHIYDSVDGSDSDESHIYESVCESSDDDDEREYYNIEELDDQVEKVKCESSSELNDPYRDNPPPLPPRPSDESSEDNHESSNECKEDEAKAKPRKPPRKLRRQTKDETTDSEGEDCPRLPPRLYDPEEENSLMLSEGKEAKSTLLSSDKTKEDNKSSDNDSDVIPSLPPRLYDEEEKHVSKEKSELSTNEKSKNLNESSVDNVDDNMKKVDLEDSSATKTTNQNNTSL